MGVGVSCTPPSPFRFAHGASPCFQGAAWIANIPSFPLHLGGRWREAPEGGRLRQFSILPPAFRGKVARSAGRGLEFLAHPLHRSLRSRGFSLIPGGSVDCEHSVLPPALRGKVARSAGWGLVFCAHPLHRSLRSRGFPLIPGGSVDCEHSVLPPALRGKVARSAGRGSVFCA